MGSEKLAFLKVFDNSVVLPGNRACVQKQVRTSNYYDDSVLHFMKTKLVTTNNDDVAAAYTYIAIFKYLIAVNKILTTAHCKGWR